MTLQNELAKFLEYRYNNLIDTPEELAQAIPPLKGDA